MLPSTTPQPVSAVPAQGFEEQFEGETRELLLSRLRLGLKVGAIL